MNLTLDLSYLEMLSDGDMEFIASILETFIEEAPKDIDNLQKAIVANDILQIGKLAHKTKSSLQTLGLAELKQMAFDIEQAAKEDTIDSSLLDTANHFVEYLQKSIPIVQEKLTAIS